MGPLPFNMWIIEYLAGHRTPGFTRVFQFASAMGEVQGYVLIGTLIYVMFDKRLAIRLVLLVALTAILNHVLKIIIKNPRPFVRQGDYLEKWAVPPSHAQVLVTDYSTPSGHAMAGSSFYGFLYGCERNRYVRILAVLAILLTGLSRPYLGVHYVEDILLGWAIGLGMCVAGLKYADPITMFWDRRPYTQQIGIAVAASLALWLATIGINGWQLDGQPRAFMGYAGTFTGIIVARPLELKIVDFDPKSSPLIFKVLRYLLSVGLAILALETLGRTFSAIAGNISIQGSVLQYIRYTIVAVVSVFLAPWIFTRIGWANTVQASAETKSAFLT